MAIAVAMREDGGDVGLERALVLAEPRVAPDAVEALLRIGHQVWRKALELVTEAFDDGHHRHAEQLLVVVAALVEPLAAVVALERTQKRERFR